MGSLHPELAVQRPCFTISSCLDGSTYSPPLNSSCLLVNHHSLAGESEEALREINGPQEGSCCLYCSHLLLMSDRHSNPHPSQSLNQRTKLTSPHTGWTEGLTMYVLHRLLNRPLGQVWWAVRSCLHPQRCSLASPREAGAD